MKIIYVAGPFRGLTPWDVAENVRAAERIGLLVAKAGAMPLIPHANTAHFEGQQPSKFWLDGTMELLRRCDGAVFIHGWRKSPGSCGEYNEAFDRAMPTLDLGKYDPWEFARVIHNFVQSFYAEDNIEEERSSAGASAEDGAG